MREADPGASRRTPPGRTSPAVAIAAEVITWVMSPGGARPRAKTPEGAMGFVELLSPPASLRSAATAAASIHSAKLGLGAPPLGDGRPMGPGGLVIAAAVGLADVQEVAGALALSAVALSGAWDLVLRDAIVRRALATSLDEDLAETLRQVSPLSAVLERPAKGCEDATIALLSRISGHGDGRRLVVKAFSRPGASRDVRRFRIDVMERLRTHEEKSLDLVLEIYEASLVFHRERAMAEIAAAREVIAGRGDPDAKLEDALAVAAWYGPLARIRRAHADLLRKRHGIDLEGMLEGTRLFQLGARLSGEDT